MILADRPWPLLTGLISVSIMLLAGPAHPASAEPSGSVVVTSVGPEGKAAPDVEYTVYIGDQVSVASKSTPTGQFRFRIADPAQATLIQARSGDLSAEANYSGEDRITLHLSPGKLCNITGSIEGPDGTPLGDAYVELLRPSGSGGALVADATRTDDAGRYRFASEFPYTDYEVAVSAPGYRNALSAPFAAAPGQQIQQPEVGLSYRFGRGLVVGPDGRPASGAEVVVVRDNDENPSGYWYTDSVKCDARGRFNFTQEEPHQLDAVIARCGDLSTAAPFIYRGEDQITLSLVPGRLCSICGSLIDEKGRPVPYAPVELADDTSGGSRRETVRTDARGMFTFVNEFPNLAYRVSGEPPGYTSSSSDTISVNSRKAVVVPPIVVHVADSYIGGIITGANVAPPVSGIVLGPDGRPAPNAYVTSRLKSGQDETVSTDDLGRFQFKSPGLKPGDWIVARSDTLAGADLERFDGQKEVVLSISDHASCDISGEVDDENNRPVAGAEVQVCLSVGDLVVNIAQTKSDEKGQYVFPRCPDDATYRVIAWDAYHDLTCTGQLTPHGTTPLRVQSIRLKPLP